MAKIKPTSEADKETFRRTLNLAQQVAFEELREQLKGPPSDLAYYHEIGRLVDRLIPPEMQERGGIGWLKKPSQALGPCPAFFQKSLRFYKDYAAKKDVERLAKAGVDWTRLYVSFAVSDREERFALLQESLEKNWSIADLRFEVQKRFTKKRLGVGGRPRSELRAHGPEVTLREMGRLTSRWLNYVDAAWLKITPAGWKRLARGKSPENRETLRQLLREVDQDLEELIGKAREARRTVAALRKRVGKP